VVGPGPETQDVRQSWYGPHYIGSLAAQAGYKWQDTPSGADVHSFDGNVIVHPGFGVAVQVKTVRKNFPRSMTYGIKKAWRTNWEALDLPGFLVVVVVPESVSGWVEHDCTWPSFTKHHTSAYWTRIDPLLPDQKRIQVKRSDRLTAETFEQWREMYEQAKVENFTGGVGL
jgi:hypothetical protein